MRNTTDIYELFRYAFWGGITTILNLILLYLFLKIHLYYIIANTIAYVIAVIINYLTNIWFVFPLANTNHEIQTGQFLKFVSVRVVALGIDDGLFFILVSLLKFPIWPSRITLSISIILATYVINKIFIFTLSRNDK